MKKRVYLSALVFGLATLSLIGQSAKKFYKAGNEFVENNKYEDAIAQFTSAIGLEPSNADYYYARGSAYEELKKYTEAGADYEKALVFQPKEVTYLVAQARTFNALGKFNEALALLNRASALDKRNWSIYPQKVITLSGLEKYDMALRVSDTAILIKDDARNHYYRGLVYVRLNNDILGKKEFEKAISKEKTLVDARLALADLLIRNNNTDEAMNQINLILASDDKNTQAYIIRSQVYKKNLDYPNAINDVSKTILIDPSNPEYYLIRGKYYQEFNQHSSAIADFSKYISMKGDNPDAFFSRAKSYEEMQNFEKAMDDYTKITALSEFDMRARKMLKEAQQRLYEMNRESDPPEVTFTTPAPSADNQIMVKGDANSITISGKIKEKSKLDVFTINDQKVLFGEKKNGMYDFIANVDLTGKDAITVDARDEYNNEKKISYKLMKTETNPPKISIVSPYTSDDGQVMLDAIKPNLYLEGKISDESTIKSIEIDGVTASYRKDQLNPEFTASIDIANINKFTVVAEDIYGNRQETEFKLNRDNALAAQNNPMGKTWVVFIENSSYETFASLDGPIKDVGTVQRALANYQVSNVIHKKDMTKAEMEKFFNIELRDLLKTNQVKSLLVWYAGHGKFINDIGYWIPVDAKRDDEFTYFNINALKAGMQSYTGLVHTLVISDACESGPSFYQAMRSANDEPTCDNVNATAMKSAQVFSSAGYELAVDNSQFTQTFANTLINNKNACIPIETIVKTVTAAVTNNNQQKPKFGKIAGLQDENGTFFFIAK
ncbi:MAG TPA: tetratricopeptide repeat protein [Bacteroidales bacterium]|nr:tetratricopeptide repeat protein [Bacteroidales bacterium]